MSTSTVYNALARSSVAREYEGVFPVATGLSVELVPTGEPAQLFSRSHRENPFCSLMAQSTGSCIACQQAHAQLQLQIADNLAPQVICCFAGLVEFAVPVVISGQHVATMLGGQVFQRKPTQTQFARLTRRLRAWGLQSEESRVEELFFQTPVIARKRIQASLQLLEIFTKLLAEDVNRNLLVTHTHDRPCITSAKNFIRAHANEPLHLSDVAKHLHVSTNYFSKFFKKATGMGYSEFLARARVKIAKKALTDPVLLINEVASQAGFGSLSQFNRIFHRYAGCSPRAYRASLLPDRSF